MVLHTSNLETIKYLQEFLVQETFIQNTFQTRIPEFCDIPGLPLAAGGILQLDAVVALGGAACASVDDLAGGKGSGRKQARRHRGSGPVDRRQPWNMSAQDELRDADNRLPHDM